MFAKLCVLIVVAGATASGLLAMRQSRIQARSELAAAHLEIARIERKLQTVRADIAARVTPDRVRDLVGRLDAQRRTPEGLLRPIIRDDEILPLRPARPVAVEHDGGER